MTPYREVPGTTQNRGADAAGRGRDIRPGRLRQSIDKRQTFCTGSGIATPQLQFAIDGQRPPDGGQFLSVALERRDRPIAGRESDLARGAVSDDMDGIKTAPSGKCCRYLPRCWPSGVERYRRYSRPQTAQHRVDVVDGLINE